MLLNPYGIAAFAALAGMFSRQATDKLREVFETLFTAQRAVPRNEPLLGKPNVTVSPEKLTVGNAQPVTITGRTFDRTVTALIGNEARQIEWISETQVKVTPLAKDVAQAGKIEIAIRSGDREIVTVPIEVVTPRS